MSKYYDLCEEVTRAADEYEKSIKALAEGDDADVSDDEWFILIDRNEKAESRYRLALKVYRDYVRGNS